MAGGGTRIESLGWWFWLGCVVVLSGPCIYVSWQVFRADVTRVAPVTAGIVLAMFAAGFITSPANWLLRRRAERLYKDERNKRRKKDRKKSR